MAAGSVIPTLSLACLRQAEADRPGAPAEDAGLAELVASVRLVCESVGFFVVVDHGVDTALMERMRHECAEFFQRPPQSTVVEMVSGTTGSRFAWLDFVPPAASSEAGVSAGAAAAGSWSLGPIEGRGSMPWRPDKDDLGDVWAEYYAAMERLVADLMRLFALALRLPADAFESALVGHRSSMRAIQYSEVLPADLAASGGEVVRSPVHTDWGCVTVLLPDPDVSGLEVCDTSGTWTPLQAPPGALVVNLGELLQFWTRGRWVATPHRVVARETSASRRLSVPYFGLINRSAPLLPLVPLRAPAAADAPDEEDADVVADEMPRITAGEFFDRHEEFSRVWSDRQAASRSGNVACESRAT
eukprot:TRINITY_DN27638_c0_g1_i1.p1 TRINITY_DN27638_c0_g1~~TRINITY_DN27638_c0_g1_i1.p1  ORF type:complete len:359 (+),score=72.73 TRINITY_DN27638_c0_g1_i1:130-1206(+)